LTENEITTDTNGIEVPRPSKLRRAWIVVILLILGTHIFVLLLGSILDRLKDKGWSEYWIGSHGSAYIALDSESNIWVGQIRTLKELAPSGDRAIKGFVIPIIESGYTHVSDLEIDKSDRIWVGLNRGLNLYAPGEGWTKYNISNSGLINDSVQAIAIDGRDRVWVGTEAGLSMLSPDMTWHTYTSRNTTIPDDDINALAVDSVGRVWVGTESGVGLIAPEGNWPDFPTTHSSIVNKAVTALYIEEDDDIWIGIRDGLNKLSANGQWTLFNISGTYYGQRIFSITADQQDRIWVTTWNELLQLDPDGRWTIYNPEYTGLPYQSGEMEDLEVAEDGRLLIGTDRGIAIFDVDKSTNVQLLKTGYFILQALGVLRCTGLIAIAFLSVISIIQWRKGRPKKWQPEAKDLEAGELWPLLNEAKRLLAEGKREEAIAVYLQAYREGSPTVRNLALKALEQLGEVEEF
jgi:hypothetical protein